MAENKGLSMEQVTYNQFSGAMSYSSAQGVAAGQTVKLSSFRAPENVDIKGVSFGATFSNANAWLGGMFSIRVNGSEIFHVGDEIGDLLRPAFLPISVHAKDLIELNFANNSTVVTDVAVKLRVVV